MDRLTKVLMQCMHQTCMAMTPREEKTLDYRRHHAPKFYEWSGHYPKRRLRSWCYIECIDQTAYDSYEEEEEYPYQEWLRGRSWLFTDAEKDPVVVYAGTFSIKGRFVPEPNRFK